MTSECVGGTSNRTALRPTPPAKSKKERTRKGIDFRKWWKTNEQKQHFELHEVFSERRHTQTPRRMRRYTKMLNTWFAFVTAQYHTYIHTYLLTSISLRVYVDICTHTHRHTHTRMPARMHIHTHTYTHTHTHAHTLLTRPACMPHIHTLAYLRAYVHTYIRDTRSLSRGGSSRA